MANSFMKTRHMRRAGGPDVSNDRMRGRYGGVAQGNYVGPDNDNGLNERVCSNLNYQYFGMAVACLVGGVYNGK